MNGKQSKMARAALGWSTHDLAQRAGIGRVTVVRFEEGGQVSRETLQKLSAAFATKLVQFSKRADRVAVSVPERDD